MKKYKNIEVSSVRKIWNVAVYARVSSDKKEQQESIPVQIQSLKKWLLDKSKSDSESVYNLVQVYEDAGVSGSTFDRESFQRMKEDIEQGKINMVLTRDLSRFARNYITAGYFLEDYFKVNGVRFISVLDNVDTQQEINDIIPFKNIINEMYIRDCSRRTKDGLKQRMVRGSCISSKPPYGYKLEKAMEGNIKTIKLIAACDETTEVVKDIFNLYLQGWGVGRIATYLNSKGIAPPSERLQNFAKAKFGLWTNNTIYSILTNEKYGGMMVQGQYKKISYKIKKIVRVPREQWIYSVDFDGIIDKNTFYEVQEQIKKRARNYRYKGNVIHPFTSVLKCNECGGSMSYRAKYEGYKCTNSQMGGGRCTAHSVKEVYLEELISEKLKRFVDKYIHKENLYEEVKNISITNNYEEELQSVEKELRKADCEFKKIYEDKLNGFINDRNFEIMVKSIQRKQDALLQRKEELNAINEKNMGNDSLYNAYKKEIDKILNMKDFNRTIVESLINKITVAEDRITKNKKIDIYFKFQS